MTGSTNVEPLYQLVRIGEFYSDTPQAFLKLRLALAKAAGIPTTRVTVAEEDGQEVSMEIPDLSEFPLVEENIYGVWQTPPADPVLYLIAHSDEAGEIMDEHLLSLGERIINLLPAVREGMDEGEDMDKVAEYFARNVLVAYEHHRPVKFRLEDCW